MFWFHTAHYDSLPLPVISFPTRNCWTRIFQFKLNCSQLVVAGHLYICSLNENIPVQVELFAVSSCRTFIYLQFYYPYLKITNLLIYISTSCLLSHSLLLPSLSPNFHELVQNFLLSSTECKIYWEFTRFHWKSWFEVKV